MPSTRSSRPAAVEYGAGWGENTFDVTCPSGATAHVRRPGVQGLVAAGVLDNVDQLGHLIGAKIAQAQGRPRTVSAAQVKKITEDPAALRTIMVVVDKIVCYVVLKPTIVSAFRSRPDGTVEEIPWDAREPGVKYSDGIPEEDRYFLLTYAVGGTSDLEQFRSELAETVGAVEHGEDVSLSAQRPARPRAQRRSRT